MEFFQHTSLSFNLLYANYPIVCRLCHLKGQIVYSGFANHLGAVKTYLLCFLQVIR